MVNEVIISRLCFRNYIFNFQIRMPKTSLKQILQQINSLTQKQMNIEGKYNKKRFSILQSKYNSLHESPNLKTAKEIPNFDSNFQQPLKYTQFWTATISLEQKLQIQQNLQKNWKRKSFRKNIPNVLKKKRSSFTNKMLIQNLDLSKQNIQQSTKLDTMISEHLGIINREKEQSKSKTIKHRYSSQHYQSSKYNQLLERLLNKPSFITQPKLNSNYKNIKISKDLDQLRKLNSLLHENLPKEAYQLFDQKATLYLPVTQIGWFKLQHIPEFSLTIINTTNLAHISYTHCSSRNGIIYSQKTKQINLQNCLQSLISTTIQRKTILHFLIHSKTKLYYEEFIYSDILHSYLQMQNRRMLLEYVMKRFLLLDPTANINNVRYNAEYYIQNLKIPSICSEKWFDFIDKFDMKYIYVSDNTNKLMKFKISKLFEDQKYLVNEQWRLMQKNEEEDILFNPKNPFDQALFENFFS